MNWVHEEVAAVAGRSPEATALTHADRRLSYAELDRDSNRLAWWLRSQGAGPEQVIGVCLPRTPQLVVALLAVLKAGAAYLPLDSELPGQRRDFMTRDSGARLVVTEEVLHAQRDSIAAQPDRMPPGRTLPGQLAYLIYTSGSTGLPKGVMVQHDQLARYLSWAVPEYTSGGRGAPLYSPVTVDLSITSLFAPLVAGRPVDLLPVENPPVTTLPAALSAGGYSFVKVTPAHLALLADTLTPAAMAAVDRLVVGGEALTFEQLAAWSRNAPDTMVINEYGPTEAVVGCCVYRMPAGEPGVGPVPIGRAVPGTRLAVLDERMQPVAAGQIGELYIAGDQVTRGYLGRPGLTAQRFRPDPEAPGRRMYRTGDLVRQLADGNLVFLGRRDDQVKINGYRIELGEVETVLAQHPQVSAAAVTVRGTNGAARLVGYLVPDGNGRPDPDDVRATAATRVPDYMLPTVFVILPALPLTPSGKVDRAALPDPRPGPGIGPAEPPSAPYQAEVAAVFADVLRHPVDRYDVDFVELGGTSLQIAQVIGRLIREYGMTLPAEAWLRTPTVAGFARLIATYRSAGSAGVRELHDEPDLDADLDAEILDNLEKEGSRVRD